jgi:hypothetical protein
MPRGGWTTVMVMGMPDARFAQAKHILHFGNDLVLAACIVGTQFPDECFERFGGVLIHDLAVHIQYGTL